MLLAQDVGLTGSALRIEEIEGPIQAFFRGLTGVDRTAGLTSALVSFLSSLRVPQKAGRTSGFM